MNSSLFPPEMIVKQRRSGREETSKLINKLKKKRNKGAEKISRTRAACIIHDASLSRKYVYFFLFPFLSSPLRLSFNYVYNIKCYSHARYIHVYTYMLILPGTMRGHNPLRIIILRYGNTRNRQRYCTLNIDVKTP